MKFYEQIIVSDSLGTSYCSISYIFIVRKHAITIDSCSTYNNYESNGFHSYVSLFFSNDDAIF